MYKQLTSEQRYAISVLLQTRTSRKVIAEQLGVSVSTISRELRRNCSKRGRYNPHLAHAMALERRERISRNSRVDESLLNESLKLLRIEQWSPKQISGYLAKQGKRISHERIYKAIREDVSGELAKHTRHKMKYRHHTFIPRPTRASNIPGRISIHERPVEVDGKRFGDWEMDLIIGKEGKGAILVLVERSTNFLIMLRLEKGKKPEGVSKAVHKVLLPYIKHVLTITTDNGSEFADHQTIAKKLKTTVYFADSYCSWQKGRVEQVNKLIRQYIPKGTSFDEYTDRDLMEIQKKINRRPREKLNFSTPKDEFFRQINKFALAS